MFLNCTPYRPRLLLPLKIGLFSCRLGLAIVPLCYGTGAPFDEHRRSLQKKMKIKNFQNKKFPRVT